MNAKFLTNTEGSIKAANCARFIQVANEISKLAAAVQIRIIPYHNRNLIHFSKLSSDRQFRILRLIEIYLNVYQAVQAEGSSLLDSKRVIWNALKHLGYRPTSDLFSYLPEGNVIEIHISDATQIFRNFNFFNFCSYSLEELYSLSIHKLYSRDILPQIEIMMLGAKIIHGFENKIIKLDSAAHVISETMSPDKLKIKDQIKYMAPLFSTLNKSIAVLTIESAELVHSNKTDEDSKFRSLYLTRPPDSSKKSPWL